jgi:cytoskeletal protein CcmA (bactofilin family)
VNGDVIAAGGTITISGPVRGSVRSAGGNLTINGSVGEDVVAAGGMVDIAPNASVGRDILLGVSSATIASPVGRNMHANVGTLQLTERAMIGGNLRYTSNQEAAIASGAIVRGQIERSTPTANRSLSPLGWVGFIALRWLRSLVGLFILGLLLVLLFPDFSRSAVRTISNAPWRSLGLGVLLLIGIPIIALILLIVGLFVGGWWLVLIALMLFGVVLVLGYIVAGLRLGRWVLTWIGQRQAHLALALLVGLALLTLLSLVPFVGFVIALLAVLFGMGALVWALVRTREMPIAPAM